MLDRQTQTVVRVNRLSRILVGGVAHNLNGRKNYLPSELKSPDRQTLTAAC